MTVHAKKIFEIDQNDCRIYLVMNGEDIFYACILTHDKGHTCAYLNLAHARWVKVSAVAPDSDFFDDTKIPYSSEFVRKFCVTYAGIENPLMVLPYRIAHNLPVQIEDYWIGFDWAENLTPTEDEILEHLSAVMHYVTESESKDA